MEEFIVSARKYRPLTFDSVVGQHALTTTLKNAIASGKLAHAYLFCGPRGVGKTTCARIFAKSINCLSPLPSGDACGECESCRAFDEQRSMSIHELDAASNNSVEDIRELCKQVLIPPQVGKYKVFIIDEVHMLSPQAFNAFLKTLEEPPSYVVFILATTEKQRILPTILSRCQVYDFQRITTQDIVEHLQKVAAKEGYEAEPEALNLIALKADGGMRDALSIFDQMASFTCGRLTYKNVCESLNVLSAEYYFKLTDHFLAGEVQPCLLLLNEILQKGFDGGSFLDGLVEHVRNLLVAREESTFALLETSEQMRQRYHEQARRCTPRFLYQAIKLCNTCAQGYKSSNNKRLQLEICLIQMAQLNDDDTPGAGLCPAKTLKPVFQSQAAQRQPAQPQQAAQTAVAAQSANKVQQPIPAATHATMPAGTASTSAAHAMRTMPTINASASTQTTGQPQLKKVTFRNIGGQKKEEAEENAQSAANLPVTPLELSAVRLAWHKFINTLPATETAMAQRMKTMQPDLGADHTVVVPVANQQVQTVLEGMRQDMETFMRRELANAKVTMIFKKADVKIEVAMSKSDHIKAIIGRNHQVGKLLETLDLELE